MKIIKYTPGDRRPRGRPRKRILGTSGSSEGTDACPCLEELGNFSSLVENKFMEELKICRYLWVHV